MQLRALVLASAILMACTPAAPAPPRSSEAATPKPPDPAHAVAPWSLELQNSEPLRPPFSARFEKGEESLFVVAVEHGCDPKTFRLIDDVLGDPPGAHRHRRRLANVAWHELADLHGQLPRVVGRWFLPWRRRVGLHAFHAAEHGASFVGGELDEQAVVQAVFKQGFTVEDLLGFYFLRPIPQFRREGALETKGLEACFRLLIDGMGKNARLEEASAHFSLDQFRDWYQKRQGRTFDIATIDRPETAPLVSGSFVQRLSAVTGVVRDRFIVQVIASHLATDKDVLVVYGGSHFATQRPALELLLGKPVEWKPGASADAGP